MRRAAVAGALILAAAGLSFAQSNAADPLRTPVFQNDSVAVTHLRFGPGARESIHTHPFPIALVQITPGAIAVQEQNTIKQGGRAGEVWYIPSERPHAVTAAGNAGSIDVIAVALLPDRPPASAGPAIETPPNVTRVTLVDNKDMRIVRVRFGPGGREPLHSHPNDLVTIQVTEGTLRVINGPDNSVVTHEPGFVQFLPRNVQHAYENTGKPFELISLTVK